jgi:hypothetical protein
MAETQSQAGPVVGLTTVLEGHAIQPAQHKCGANGTQNSSRYRSCYVHTGDSLSRGFALLSGLPRKSRPIIFSPLQMMNEVVIEQDHKQPIHSSDALCHCTWIVRNKMTVSYWLCCRCSCRTFPVLHYRTASLAGLLRRNRSTGPLPPCRQQRTYSEWAFLLRKRRAVSKQASNTWNKHNGCTGTRRRGFVPEVMWIYQ